MANRMASAIANRMAVANRMAKPMAKLWQTDAPNPNPNYYVQDLSSKPKAVPSEDWIWR